MISSELLLKTSSITNQEVRLTHQTWLKKLEIFRLILSKNLHNLKAYVYGTFNIISFHVSILKKENRDSRNVWKYVKIKQIPPK